MDLLQAKYDHEVLGYDEEEFGTNYCQEFYSHRSIEAVRTIDVVTPNASFKELSKLLHTYKEPEPLPISDNESYILDHEEILEVETPV